MVTTQPARKRRIPAHEDHNAFAELTALSALQFPFYGCPNEGSPILPILQHGLDPVESTIRESSLHIFGPLLFASHLFLI